MKVQLLYFPGCPNIALARESIQRCLKQAGLALPLEEVDVSAAETPEGLKGWGSPTILVNGADVGGITEPSSGESCRVYDGSRGVPSDEVILGALKGGNV